MSFQKARISLDYLYNYVMKNAVESRKLSKMPMATFHRNLKTLTLRGTIKRKNGSGRPRALNPMMKAQFAKKFSVAPWNNCK